MFDPTANLPWLRRLSAAAVHMGFARAWLMSSLLLGLGSVALAQAVALWVDPRAMLTVLLATAVVLSLLAPVLCAGVLLLVFQLEAARRRHSGLATEDELTGMHNRRHFMMVAEREWARCRRYAEDGAMLLIAADHFKALKGSQGAACCDAMLRDITVLVTRALRQSDLPARFGGETLVVYLPNTDPLGALDVAERIREAVASHRMHWRDQQIGTTVSIGVASAGATHHNLDALVQDARAALQAARQAGQNCVRAAPVQPRMAPVIAPPAATGMRGRRP